MSAADPATAVAAYLDAQEAIATLTAGKVFRPELPESEQKLMPMQCVVVRPAGGGTLFQRDYLPVTDRRIDILCYGQTRLQAENLSDEVALAMKMLTRSTWEKVVLFWARVTAQPASAIQPEVNWPFALVSTQVMCGSVAKP